MYDRERHTMFVTFNYAEYPWVTSNIKAREAAQKKDFNEAVNQYKKSNEILKNLSKYEDVELLLSEVRMMRFDCFVIKANFS